MSAMGRDREGRLDHHEAMIPGVPVSAVGSGRARCREVPGAKAPRPDERDAGGRARLILFR